MATTRSSNSPLFATTEDAVKTGAKAAQVRDNTPNKADTILAQGAARAKTIQSVGSIVSDAVSVDEIRLKKKHEANKIFVGIDAQKKFKTYQDKVKYARDYEAAKKLRVDFLREVSAFTTNKHDNGEYVISDNRTKEWFQKELVPQMKANADLVYDGKQREIQELTRKTNYASSQRYLETTATSLEELSDNVAVLDTLHASNLPEDMVPNVLRESRGNAAYNTMINRIGADLDAKTLAPQDMMQTIAELKAMDEEVNSIFPMTPEQRNAIAKHLKITAQRARAQHASAVNAQAEQARLEIEKDENTLYAIYREVEDDPRNFATRVDEMKYIVAVSSMPEKRKLKWDKVIREATNPNPRPSNKDALEVLGMAFVDPDLTRKDRQALFDRLVLDEGLVNLTDATPFQSRLNNQLVGDKKKAFNGFMESIKARAVLGGFEFKTDTGKDRRIFNLKEGVSASLRKETELRVEQLGTLVESWLLTDKDGVVSQSELEGKFKQEITQLMVLNEKAYIQDAMRRATSKAKTSRAFSEVRRVKASAKDFGMYSAKIDYIKETNIPTEAIEVGTDAILDKYDTLNQQYIDEQKKANK